MGEELTGPSVAALHLIEDQQHPVLVAERAQPTHEVAGHRSHAAFALYRLNQNAAGLRCHELLDGSKIARCGVLEALQRRAEALEVVPVPRGCDSPERAAVEGARERDDLVAVLLAPGPEVVASGLDRALDGLCAGVGKEA